MKTIIFFMAFFATIALQINAQTNPQEYLDMAMRELEVGNCDVAQTYYDIYKEKTGKTLVYLEKSINKCHHEELERKNKRDSYLKDKQNSFVALPFVTYGTGFPWNVMTSVEFRVGEITGFGMYGDLGINLTYIDYTCNHEQGNLTKGSFKYAIGMKYYFHKGFFLDFGYGSMAPSSTTVSITDGKYHSSDNYFKESVKDLVTTGHGLLLHVGDMIFWGDKLFLGISVGALYDVIHNEVAPSIILKIGGAIK